MDMFACEKMKLNICDHLGNRSGQMMGRNQRGFPIAMVIFPKSMHISDIWTGELAAAVLCVSVFKEWQWNNR